MSEKPPDKKDEFMELFKKLWPPIGGIISGVTLVYNFYRLWIGDQKTVTYILAIGGFLLLIIAVIWVGFGTQMVERKAIYPVGTIIKEVIPRFNLLYRRIAWVMLGIILAYSVISIPILIQHWKDQKQLQIEREQKLIVVIAAFEGPEEVYGLRNKIIETLNEDFSDDEEIEIMSTAEMVSVGQGSDYARQLGENSLADVVIWGWYRPTVNPNVTIHVENLSPEQFLPIIDESVTLQPAVTLAELESFSFQQQISEETSALIFFLAGYIDLVAKKYDLAITRFDQVLANILEEPRLLDYRDNIYFYRGSAYYRIKKYSLAIQDFGQAIELNPQFALAYNNRGGSYFYLQDYPLAIQDFDRAIELNPNFAYAYNSRGASYYYLEDYPQAIDDFSYAIELNSQFIEAYYSIGEAYNKLRDYPKAIESFNQAIEIAPQFFKAYNGRAGVYLNLGDYSRAILDYDRAIEINPKFVNAYYHRGSANNKLGNYQLAIQDFNQAIELNPEFFDAYNNRGLAYEGLGNHSHAIQDYSKAIDINPLFPEAYVNRGSTYHTLGDYSLAIKDFDQAITINPQFTAAYNNRGAVYSALGDYQRAITDYDRVIAIDPQLALAYFNRGQALQKLGKITEAKADFAKYEELTGKKFP